MSACYLVPAVRSQDVVKWSTLRKNVYNSVIDGNVS